MAAKKTWDVQLRRRKGLSLVLSCDDRCTEIAAEALEKEGYGVDLIQSERPQHTTVEVRSNKEIDADLICAILKTAGLAVESKLT